MKSFYCPPGLSKSSLSRLSRRVATALNDPSSPSDIPNDDVELVMDVNSNTTVVDDPNVVAMFRHNCGLCVKCSRRRHRCESEYTSSESLRYYIFCGPVHFPLIVRVAPGHWCASHPICCQARCPVCAADAVLLTTSPEIFQAIISAAAVFACVKQTRNCAHNRGRDECIPRWSRQAHELWFHSVRAAGIRATGPEDMVHQHHNPVILLSNLYPPLRLHTTP
ncbi:hypothetical protein P879_09946 [Paragonimus westermani]|uniref:Uncharacterized protein n=1 Tax=Paragonimus westermani TaxID=34504 RepID=A0A8T0CYT2_9TREM|nr:hypothetical protein P879_09946 [Paragonimus westermani]